jgi:hypothetical protein
MTTDLPGSFHVRILRAAFHDAHHWLPRSRDRAELRRQALKLRFWPENHPEDEAGRLLDLNWEWIKALKGLRIGELQIDDTIGDCDNLRVIFFVPKQREPYPAVWILSVFQKKRMEFTKAQLKNFAGRRTIVLERFYERI